MLLRTVRIVRSSVLAGPAGKPESAGATIHCLSGTMTPRGNAVRTLEVGNVSSTARWIICTVCAILGVIGLIYAVIYLSVPIHSLPGFVPGKHPVNGHYHKRAALAGVIGIVLLAIAIFVGLGARRSAAAGTGSSPGPASPPNESGNVGEAARPDGGAGAS